MDRAFRCKHALIIWLILIMPVCWSQQINGVIVNEQAKPVAQAKVVSGQYETLTSSEGAFEIVPDGEYLIVVAESYDRQMIAWKELKAPVVITLKPATREMDEVRVIQNRMLRFDIGYLPPVKGVQIATGTNAIIQTEGQQGAKSTGNPRELFAKIPGINIWESDGAGIQMGVGGRGLSPNRAANFNMRQNGYDISADALGYPESYYTPPLEALSSIEIIRGSASLQYGTQFGGLMNFVLRDPAPDSPLEVTSRITGGSFGYLGTFNRIGGTHKRLSYQVYHQYKQGNGYRKFSDFTQHQGFGQLIWNMNTQHQLKVEFTTMHYNAQQPGGLTDFQFNENVMQVNRERNWFGVNWNMVAAHYTFESKRQAVFNVRAFAMHSNRFSLGYLGKISQVDPGGQRELIAGYFRNAGTEVRWLKRYKIKAGKKAIKSAFLAGARYYQGKTTAQQGLANGGNQRAYQFTNPNDLDVSDYDFPSRNIALFTDNIFFLGNRWFVNAGARLEYISSASAGYYKQYAIHPLNHDTLAINRIDGATQLDRVVPLYGAGISYKTSRQTTLYTNYCLNYRAVNFNDIRVSNPNVVVDTNMRDEYGYTFELGYRGLLSKHLYIDVAAFYLFYGDKIGLAPESNGTRKIRTNIGDAVNRGIEAFVEWDFIQTFRDSSDWSTSIFANFAWIEAQYINSKERSYIGKQVEYVSPIVLRGGLKIKYKKWSMQAQYSYNSGQYADASNAYAPSADAVIGYIPAYSVMDLSCRGELPKGFQLEVGVNNLLNAIYFTRRASAYPGPGILPSDGRSFYLTLQYRFKK